MMNSRPEFTKLLQLRSKTDRQLIAFITSRLNAGLNYARLVIEPRSDSDWASAEAFHAGAAKACDEVGALLPWVNDVTNAERRRLELKLEQLRELLNESTIHAGMRVQTACS
jgi:hypothetical protein